MRRAAGSRSGAQDSASSCGCCIRPCPGRPGMCIAAAGLFTVEVDPAYTQAQVDAFVDALKLFRIGWSWGGPVSLAVPYRAQGMRSVPVPYQGALVRFSVGLEEVGDLIADVEQA